MPKYNLDALGHEEFEHLCQSLVQQIIGPGTKVYGMGSDGAREATFQGKAPYPSKEEKWDGSWIFQAKFHNIQQIGPKEARRSLLAELDNELSKIIDKYDHPCDNFILMTNVSLTPVFQKGIKDKIDNEIIPKYRQSIKHIHIWGDDEICRFLDAYPNIRQTYSHLLISGDIVAHLLKYTEREETDLDELVKLYCQGCFNHEQYAVLDDAGDVDDKRVKLQKVFIDLIVKPPTISCDHQMLERLPLWLKQASGDEERTSAFSYLFDDLIQGLVLIGGPGEGKSTLGQYLIQIHRARLIGKLNELGKNIEEFDKCIPRVPFRILLKEYAQWISSRDDSDSLFHYIAAQVARECGKTTNPEDIHKIVKANPVLLLLDGLDEVPEKKLRARVLDSITSFVNQVREVHKGNLRIIATTRPYGYSEEFDPIHYLHITLQKLSPEKVTIYGELWTNAREPILREAERIQNTLTTCLKDKVVSVLTQTPLQVTILLVIIRARGAPPKQREELFERYMDIIYQREQKKGPELLRTEQDIIYGLHKYLAYILHRRAEQDKTAALMDVSEFEEKVKDYLFHGNPLLKQEEIETKVKQIITEASQRLVLIESLQERKVGFGLTTTREFFAGAHLVDSAKNTKERDLRFKAIAKSPHWRNVALFFAGRVGRTRPGEAPSMIDVCRQIDTERVDKYLRRGAELVMEMADDRVLREPHNEIGAIQYGLTLIDRGLIKDTEEFINKLKSFPEQYKERVIRPSLEEKLKVVIPENISLYITIYQALFGINEPVLAAIKRASDCGLQEVKLWALSKAIESKIADIWVIQLLEELVETIPNEKIVSNLYNIWINFGFYLDFSLSSKARIVLAQALFDGTLRHFMRGNFPITDLSMIKPEGKYIENSLLLWAVYQLSICSNISMEERNRKKDWSVELNYPGIANPKVKEIIKKNEAFIEKFCKVFSKDKDPFVTFLVALYEFLLKPQNREKYLRVLKHSQEKENYPFFIHAVSLLLGRVEYYDRSSEVQTNISTVYGYYQFEEQYRKDNEELNELINRQSENISNHPQKLLAWIVFNCNPKIENLLDPDIVKELKFWLEHRGLSEKILSLRRWSFREKTDLDLAKFVLYAMENQLEDKTKAMEPWVLSLISEYKWNEPKTKDESIIAERLKNLFENVLTNYSSIIDHKHQLIENFYWCILNAKIIEEKHMERIYELIKDDANFPSMPWYARNSDNSQKSLKDMLRSKNVNITRLAAESLPMLLFFFHDRKTIDEIWIVDKFYKLAKNKKDIWRLRYINGMASCRLNWEKHCKEWPKAIKEANTEELLNAWCGVIAGAGYYDHKDRTVLFNLLLYILDSSFEKPIKSVALQRLYEMVQEIEPLEFDEEELNLPLSRRPRAIF